MEVLLATQGLTGPGGVQSYLLTVGPQLERLGHAVTLWAPERGDVAALAVERGLRVAEVPPPRCAAVISQDAATAFAMAARYPEAARVIVVHGADLDLHLPPALDGVVHAAVAMNDRTRRRAEACAAGVPVRRLRQPIDTERFRPEGARRERPGRALLLGNYLRGARQETVVRACAAAGLAVERVGRGGDERTDPAAAIARCDLVIGQGRSVLEGMACGRAAYVLGPGAADGWVTDDSYPALEADGFAGTASPVFASEAALASDLAAWTPELGDAGRAVALARHTALEHVVELVELIDSIQVRPPAPGDQLEELARLTRSRYDADVRGSLLAADMRAVHARVAELEHQLAVLKRTRRYRTAQALARPVEVARRLRGRR